MQIEDFLGSAGLKEKQIILMHSSFRRIKEVFYQIEIKKIIGEIQNILTPGGSLAIPAFTYCFEKSDAGYEKFNRLLSPSRVGAVSEAFRNMPDVVRTSSPTHSFALWGRIAEEIGSDNNPESPLGKGSVMDWIAGRSENSYVFMFGCDFTSFTFGHYLEIVNKVPWYDYSPWEYLGVRNSGVSIDGKIRLKEVPGCSKSFVNFEKYLLDNNLIERKKFISLEYYFINVSALLNHGSYFYKEHISELLCPAGNCKACDARHQMLNKINL